MRERQKDKKLNQVKMNLKVTLGNKAWRHIKPQMKVLKIVIKLLQSKVIRRVSNNKVTRMKVKNNLVKKIQKN
jgi:hypothetical protein